MQITERGCCCAASSPRDFARRRMAKLAAIATVKRKIQATACHRLRLSVPSVVLRRRRQTRACRLPRGVGAGGRGRSHPTIVAITPKWWIMMLERLPGYLSRSLEMIVLVQSRIMDRPTFTLHPHTSRRVTAGKVPRSNFGRAQPRRRRRKLEQDSDHPCRRCVAASACRAPRFPPYCQTCLIILRARH